MAMEQTKILQHLEALVGFNAETRTQANVLELLNYCNRVLQATGVFHDCKIHTFNGYHNLTASTQNTKSPRVLLQGHIDVVPAPSELVYHVKDEKVFGRGVFDMLFATACYLAFIEEHKDKLRELDFGIMLTGDEEIGGVNGVMALLEHGYGADVCILPDAGNGFGDLNISAKGVYHFKLVVKGRAHHGSRPWEGDGAANKLVLALHALLAEFDMYDKNNSTMTVAILGGGDANNKGPSTAAANVDIRFKDKLDFVRIQNKIEQICQKYTAHLEGVELGSDYNLNTDDPYVAQFIDLYKKRLGKGPTLGKAHGSSDARYFSDAKIPVIMFRPDGGGAHADDEYLSLASLDKFYTVFEEYVMKAAKI